MSAFRQPNPVYSPEYQRLREVLISARLRSGLSQRQLAVKIGKSHSHVCMIERGQRRIDILEFDRIARSLDADPLALYDAATRPT